MGPEGAIGGGVGVQHEGNRIGHKPRAPERHEKPEGMGPDEGVLNLEAVLAKMGRLVHGIPGLMLPEC
jgi:hypothetical protein